MVTEDDWGHDESNEAAEETNIALDFEEDLVPVLETEYAEEEESTAGKFNRHILVYIHY